MSPGRPTRRVLFGTASVAAAAALTAGTAWACPPDPGNQQTRVASAQGEGRDLGAHAGHGPRDVGKTSQRVSNAIKGVKPVGNVPDAKESTSLVFMDYGKGKNKRTIMYVSGRFGLKAYDLTADPKSPPLVGTFDLPGFWQGEDTEADHKRKIIYLSRDPRAFGGNTDTGESGIYVIDVSKPESLKQLTYVKVPAGHTTSCVNDCRYLWTGGPAKASWMPADWAAAPCGSPTCATRAGRRCSRTRSTPAATTARPTTPTTSRWTPPGSRGRRAAAACAATTPRAAAGTR
ncbi:hypothetical protein ACFQU9_09380 [Actinomadura namibiensis]|uniref:hypothetical protein n=1 Tax=Actinomadura kijaniata TaxID=46161 RepID=UPI0036228211